jgi:hypothetical protein
MLTLHVLADPTPSARIGMSMGTSFDRARIISHPRGNANGDGRLEARFGCLDLIDVWTTLFILEHPF